MSDKAVTIVPITEIHRVAVTAMWRASFAFYTDRGAPAALFPRPEFLDEKIADWVDGVVLGAARTGLVALSGGRALGFAAASIGEWHWLNAPRVATISMIWIEPDARRCGNGRLLGTALLDSLSDRMVDSIELSAYLCNAAARPFWEDLGFTACATQMIRVPPVA